MKSIAEIIYYPMFTVKDYLKQNLVDNVHDVLVLFAQNSSYKKEEVLLELKLINERYQLSLQRLADLEKIEAKDDK